MSQSFGGTPDHSEGSMQELAIGRPFAPSVRRYAQMLPAGPSYTPPIPHLGCMHFAIQEESVQKSVNGWLLASLVWSYAQMSPA